MVFAMLPLFPNEPKPQRTLKEQKGKRKKKRNLPKRKPIHLILKSRYILLTHKGWIQEKINKYGKKFFIKVHNLAICGDHVHFAIEIPHRDEYNKFIRTLTGVIARKMGRGIWSLMPLTKVFEWNRGFRNLMAYIDRNRLEAVGKIAYKPRIHQAKMSFQNFPPQSHAISNPRAPGIPSNKNA
jgi:REP element-mobilizing transposase RayT